MLDVLAPSGLIICSQKFEQTIRQETTMEITKEPVQHPGAVLLGRLKPPVPNSAAQPCQVVLVSLVENRVLVTLADCSQGTPR